MSDADKVKPPILSEVAHKSHNNCVLAKTPEPPVIENDVTKIIAMPCIARAVENLTFNLTSYCIKDSFEATRNLNKMSSDHMKQCVNNVIIHEDGELCNLVES